MNTFYGRPMKPFFIEIQNFWAWADNHQLTLFQLEEGRLSSTITTGPPKLFNLLALTILGFEFEFGPQRIRNLAFVCP